MILDQLGNIGALVSEEGYRTTSFEWTPADGADPVKFDSSVKREPTVADFEFINMQDIGADDRSVMARSVHRMVRIDKINGEKTDQQKLSLEDCSRLKPNLLLALFVAIGDTAKKPPAKTPARKAPARKTATKTA